MWVAQSCPTLCDPYSHTYNDLISKLGHMLRHWRLGLEHIFWQGQEGYNSMDGQHLWCNGCEFGQTSEDGEDKEAWHAAVHGVAKSQTRLGDWTTTIKYKFNPWTLNVLIYKMGIGTSLVVQQLRLHALNAGDMSSIPGQGTRAHMPQLRPSAAK